MKCAHYLPQPRAVVAVLCLLLPAAIFAQTIPPSDDAHVSTTFSSTNFGASPLLQVGATANAGSTRAFIKFNLSSLPAGTNVTSISKVNLILFVNTVGTAGTLQVSQLTSAWSEGTVTFSTEPTTGAVVGTIPVSAGSQFVSIDVTSLFQQWLTTPASNQGVVLDPVGSAVAVYLDSKESVTTSHAPVLQIIQAGPAGATGAVGATGVAGATGVTGATGMNGATGPTGAVGATGATGAIGPTGANGLNGATGLAGVTGATGATGAAGLNGATGATGVAGLNGATGAIGPIGPTGAAGLNTEAMELPALLVPPGPRVQL